MTDLADTLKKLRFHADYNLNFVAKKIGISSRNYSRWEAGEVEIKLKDIIKIAGLYKITVDDILHYGEPGYNAEDPKATYQKKLSTPVTVTLDGTTDTLKMWFERLTAINAAI
jgi:transcriptional regulator with XRE-family HTH domain